MNGEEPPSTAAIPVSQPPLTMVAPAWHTIIVLLFMLTLSALSYYSQSLAAVPRHTHVANYLAAMITEWVVVAFIWFGLRLRKQRLSVLLGDNWRGVKGIFRDFLIGVGFLIVANIVLAAIGHLLKAKPNAAVKNLLPHGGNEIAVYFLLTVTAGICEEIIFRGYFQRQFSAWFKNATTGLVLQGILFGASHGYQGAKSMLIIVVYGVMFGMLARWQRSLRPGMFAHFMQDFGAGLIGGRYLK